MRCHVNSVYDKEVTLARVESMDSGYPVDSVSSSDTCLQKFTLGVLRGVRTW